MFSDVVVFGQVLCVLKHVFSRFWYTFVRGVPPEAYQGGHSEAQWCHMVPRCAFSLIFHRLWGPFWKAFSNMLHHFRHPVSECFFEGDFSIFRFFTVLDFFLILESWKLVSLDPKSISFSEFN